MAGADSDIQSSRALTREGVQALNAILTILTTGETSLSSIATSLAALVPSSQVYAFADLPASPALGDRVLVTDSNTATFNATVAGGGANVIPAFWNGTNWKVG